MIIQNRKVYIHPNFMENEFFSKSPNVGTEHKLDSKVVQAVFFLRDYFKSPIKINSTLRTKEHNALIGGHPVSKHVSGEAIDFSILNEAHHKEFIKEIQDERGFLFLSLRELGVTAIGLYDNFIHIDCGDYDGQNSSSLKSDMFGKWKIWNNTSEKKNLFRSLMNKTD